MTLKTRKVLFITFVLAFFIITPLVLTYAAGYKINLNNGLKIGIDFEKTGMFVLDTFPKGAKISINGEPQELFLKKYYSQQESLITTPAKIKNLLPGEYEVKIEKEGYWPWVKKLKIYPGASTYAEDIVLFKNNQPIGLLEGDINNYVMSPDKKKLAVLNDKKMRVISLPDEEIKEVVIDKDELDMQWSPENDKLLAGQKVINTNGDVINFEDLKEINQLKWADNNIILASSVNKNSYSLSEIDLISKTSKVLISREGELLNFLVKKNDLFLIEKFKDEVKLHAFDLETGANLQTIKLPSLLSYEFINPNHRLLNIYDRQRQMLYLIDPFSAFPLEATIENLKYSEWINDNRLLYSNDYEIWIMDLGSKQKTLFTRISSPIKKAIWHPSNNYIIYSTDNSLNIMELDDREKRNITQCLLIDKLSVPYLNAKGDTLYFAGEIGGKKGFYKLIIQ